MGYRPVNRGWQNWKALSYGIGYLQKLLLVVFQFWHKIVSFSFSWRARELSYLTAIYLHQLSHEFLWELMKATISVFLWAPWYQPMDPDFDTRRCLGILWDIGQVPKRLWEHWDATELTSEGMVRAKGCSWAVWVSHSLEDWVCYLGNI